jgi:membrane protein implicated in regulation of membrane protease activity
VILLLVILVVVFAPVSQPWSVVLILVGCGLEVIEIVLLRRWAKRLDKRTKVTTGPEAMIGETAEVVEDCDPNGMVQLRGELWEARCEQGAQAGDTVRVESFEGLTLVVAR